MDSCDVAIVGGGVYGCAIAEFISNRGKSVSIFEKDKALMSNASFKNQARIHRGYHYPRSFLTGNRSQASYYEFIEKFSDCCVPSKSYYGIAKTFSKISGSQFAEFCKKIDAPIFPIGEFGEFLDSRLIEKAYEVEEVIFNSQLLMNKFSEKLQKNKVSIHLNTQIEKVVKNEQLGLLELYSNSGQVIARANKVYLCVYSSTCKILNNSGITCPPIKNEWTEMAMVKVPKQLENINFTLMDGQFFSLMKFPAYNCHTLSHVRFTPHSSWVESDLTNGRNPELAKNSNYNYMIKDASRFIPILKEAEYLGSIWEVKTLLQLSEGNDSRPILYKKDIGFPGLSLVLGGKIDNIFEIIRELEEEYEK